MRYGLCFCRGYKLAFWGGKTAIARRISELLPDSVPLFFGEYDGYMVHPLSIQQWLREGADYNAWELSRLEADLSNLKAGKSILQPLNGAVVAPGKYVIFDNPLGYAHAGMARLVDFMVFVDTPLDIAMARRLLRDFSGEGKESVEERIKALRAELANYLDYGRQAYFEMDRQIKPACNLVVDGSAPVDALAHGIVEEIRARVEGKVRCP